MAMEPGKTETIWMRTPSRQRQGSETLGRNRAQQAQEGARKTHTQDPRLQLPPEPALQFSAPATPTPGSRPQFMPQPAPQFPCSLYPNLFYSLYLSSNTAYTPTYAISCTPGPIQPTICEASPAPLPESTAHTGFQPQVPLAGLQGTFHSLSDPSQQDQMQSWAQSLLCSEQGKECLHAVL